MKWPSILPLYAATATPYSSRRVHGPGVCESDDHPFWPSGTTLVSLPDLPDYLSLARADKGTPGQHSPSSAGHSWTFSSPCIHIAALEEDICVFSDSNFAGGRGISLVISPARASFIASQPVFSHPGMLQPIANQDLFRTVPPKYVMKEFPGKGIGVEVTRFIKRGELIMANTPSVMIDQQSADYLTEQEYMGLLEIGVGYLPKAHHTAVMQLSIHDNATHLTKSQVIGKILAINSFDVPPDVEEVDQSSNLYGLFVEIPRINHDCRPNTKYYFDYRTMTQYVHAVRDILPGEELSVSYINLSMGRQDRVEQLGKTWGFQCRCAACASGKEQTEASDDRVQQINSIIAELQSYDESSVANPALAEHLASLYEQENLWGTLYISYIFAALEYSGAGDDEKATEYARLALEYGIIGLGKKSSDMVEMETLADNPREHWSWLRRRNEKTV
ncbi:SET domain-containing protein [Thozetella sp. PMI_491]|nr:SET domain-containing protein [Thozetella sp. PMI_491]